MSFRWSEVTEKSFDFNSFSKISPFGRNDNHYFHTTSLHEGSSEPTGEVMTDGGEVCLETGFNYEVVRELIKMGHKVRFDVGNYGGYQAIMFDPVNKIYYGASESRKDGQAAGY